VAVSVQTTPAAAKELYSRGLVDLDVEHYAVMTREESRGAKVQSCAGPGNLIKPEIGPVIGECVRDQEW